MVTAKPPILLYRNQCTMPRKSATKATPKPDRAPSPGMVLNAVLDLREAGPLTARLLAERGSDIAIDASAVQRLGGQCLQVLLAARASWAADGNDFRIDRLSPAILATLDLLGVAPAALNCATEAAS